MTIDILEAAHPFNEFVVKIAGRCNLNCSYCYMYNLADQSYGIQPKLMDDVIFFTLIDKIAAYTQLHSLESIGIVLHGGEPLLLPKKRFDRFVKYARERIESQGCAVTLGIQTNGTLIDDEWISLFAENDVLVGISVDGPELYHDIFRVDHAGKGSYKAVMDGIKKIKDHPDGELVFSGILSVINTDIDPKSYYEFLKEIDPPSANLLLPKANHAFPPAKKENSYGDWLVKVLQAWLADDNPYLRIRIFENALRLFLGGKAHDEGLGTDPVGLLVIETNGDLEPSDNLKPCGDGFTKTGLNIITNEIDDALNIPLIHTARKLSKVLCESCQTCEFVQICGAGQAVERYSEINGFDNPSVYCEDYKKLYQHMYAWLIENLPKDIIEEAQHSAADHQYA